jgi:hypothetical protein
MIPRVGLNSYASFKQMIQQSNDIAIAGITGLNGATEKK